MCILPPWQACSFSSLILVSHGGLFLTTVILGGFTTFSAFSRDAVVLYEREALGPMAVYVIASVVLSIGGLFAGLFIMRQFG